MNIELCNHEKKLLAKYKIFDYSVENLIKVLPAKINALWHTYFFTYSYATWVFAHHFENILERCKSCYINDFELISRWEKQQ